MKLTKSKGSPINFRPTKEMRQRIEVLTEATERDITYVVEKCLSAHLEVLEKKYAADIAAYLKANPAARLNSATIAKMAAEHQTALLNEAPTTGAAAPPRPPAAPPKQPVQYHLTPSPAPKKNRRAR